MDGPGELNGLSHKFGRLFFFNYLKTYYFFRIFSLLEYIFKSFELNKRNIIADNSCFSSASAL